MATEHLTPELAGFLERCSDDMASQVMSALQQAGRRALPNAAPSMTAIGSAVTKIEKKQRKKAKSIPATGGPKRPLNSWMAYRKYYNRVLEGSTQKAISKCLTQLWKADLFTAKWALLAKAYSIVRGCGEKKDAPLDDFFNICAPLVGIIPPENYLQAMGWQLSPPVDGDQERIPQLTRFFEPTPASLERDWPLAATTNLGVDDLVNICYDNGYGKPSDNGSQNASSHGSLTMASRPNAMMTNVMGDITHMTPFAQTDTTPTFNEATSDSSMNDLLLAAASPLPAMTFDGASPLPLQEEFSQEQFDNGAFSPELFDSIAFSPEMSDQAISATDNMVYPHMGAELDLDFNSVLHGDEFSALLDFSGGQ